jgi:hypothetical protein
VNILENHMKNYELVDAQAIRRLREIYKLDRIKAAKLSRLSEAQIQDLEEGAMLTFPTPAMKIQAALQYARALSGERANGLPYANVMKGGQQLSAGELPFPVLTPKKYTYRTNPKDLILVSVIFTFVFLAVAVPVMSATYHVRQRGDILIPRTWKP